MVDELQLISQACPTSALLDLSPNDIPINLAYHGSNLNMQVSSGTQNNFPFPNEEFRTTETMSFDDVLLVVTSTRSSPY
ncbi:hypothetical protein TNCV_4164761 [Trichonephila clavipes]|nr:hypothetical protein TNCV_4164761 [Trichonephila clavipes]